MIFLQGLNVFLHHNNLMFAGDNGIIKINTSSFISKLQIIILKDSIKINTLLNDEISSNLKNELIAKVNKTIINLTAIKKKKLVLFGIGFKCWVYKDKNNMEHIALKVGFSRDICVKIPFMIKVISLKPTLVLFKSLDIIKLTQFVAFLRSLKVPDIYKGKGIQYANEKIVLKIGKHN